MKTDRSEIFDPVANAASGRGKWQEVDDVSTRIMFGGSAGEPAEPKTTPKVTRLVADQPCFGLDALTFCTGAARVLERIGAQKSPQPAIDVRSLGEDFHLNSAASWTLLRELLAAGLMRPDCNGCYCPTAGFQDYARARVVAPLSRARAKGLITRAIALATRINAGWSQNPYQIQELAVAGSYMSRSDSLSDLCLWLVPRKRPETRALRAKASPAPDDAMNQIVAAMTALSSFAVVRVARERQQVARPFVLVFEAEEEVPVRSEPKRASVREWGASIGRRLVPKK